MPYVALVSEKKREGGGGEECWAQATLHPVEHRRSKFPLLPPLPQSLSQPNETQTGGDNDKQRDWEQKQHSFTNPLQNHLNSSTKSSHNHKSKTNKNKTLNFLIRIPKSK